MQSGFLYNHNFYAFRELRKKNVCVFELKQHLIVNFET